MTFPDLDQVALLTWIKYIIFGAVIIASMYHKLYISLIINDYIGLLLFVIYVFSYVPPTTAI